MTEQTSAPAGTQAADAAPAPATPAPTAQAPAQPVAAAPVAEPAPKPVAAKPEKAAPSKDDPYSSLEMRPGTPLNEQHLADIKVWAAKHELEPKAAQAVLDREAEIEAAMVDLRKETVEGWLSALEQDKELGGQNMGRTQKRVLSALSSYADQQFVQELQQSGWINHPGFARMMEKLGKHMEEPAHIARGGNVAAGGKPSWETLFPNSPAPRGNQTAKTV